jgi:hypothetical protein
VRREIAATADLHSRSLQISSFVRNDSANRIAIRLCPNQLQAEPMIPAANFVPQQHRRPVVHGNQDVYSAVVVEITES